MLPDESLRFFSLDATWVASLLDGACSIGRYGKKDQREGPLFDRLFEQVCANAYQLPGAQQLHVTGFLLRSQLVDGWWPGMKIDAYGALPSQNGDQRLLPLRQEKLGPGTLLCLYQGQLNRVDFHPPPEGLHLGLLPDPSQGWRKQLRNMVNGVQTGSSPWLNVLLRGSGPAIQVSEFAKMMKTELNADTFTAAEFGMQMIEAPSLARFINAQPPA
jgi:hypothetical protein